MYLTLWVAGQRNRTGRSLTRLGGFVSNEAVGNDSPRLQIGRALASQRRALSGQRWLRVAFECAYDAVSWNCGLLAAAWMTRDQTGIPFTAFTFTRDMATICLLSAAAGLLAGLYRGRYQRGSLDEVMGVGMAACVMALFLVVISPRLISGQHAALQAVAGSTMFALARHARSPVRTLRRPPARPPLGGGHRERHRLRRR